MTASNAAVEGLAGSLGGVTALLATYPLMTVYSLLIEISSSRCLSTP